MLDRPRIVAPKSAKAGDVIEIRTLITPSEIQPVDSKPEISALETSRYIRDFTADFENTRVFQAKLTENVSSNPYISFYMKATKTGDLVFTWQENTGRSWTSKHRIEVN